MDDTLKIQLDESRSKLRGFGDKLSELRRSL